MGPKSHVDGEACFTLSFTHHCFVVVVVVVVVVVAAIVIAELGIHIPKKWILQTLNNSNFSTDDMAHGELGVIRCGTLCKQCGGTVPGELPNKRISNMVTQATPFAERVGNKMLTSAKHVVT